MDERKDDLVSPLRVYSVAQDDAIDLLRSDVVGYAGDIVTPAGGRPVTLSQGTRNPALIVALPTRHLRAAVVAPLTMGVGVQLDDIASMNGRAFQAFRVACLAVENIPIPGASLGPTEDVRLADGRMHKVWSDDELDRLQSLMGRNYMYEVGTVILERSLSGKARGGVPLYTPQPFLEPALTQSAFLRAEQSRSAAGIDSNAASPPSSIPTPEPSCADPGAAPAEMTAPSPAE